MPRTTPVEGLRVPLGALELRYSAEVAFPDASARRIGEIGIAHRVAVSDLVENAVVGHQVFDWWAGHVICVQLL